MLAFHLEIFVTFEEIAIKTKKTCIKRGRKICQNFHEIVLYIYPSHMSPFTNFAKKNSNDDYIMNQLWFTRSWYINYICYSYDFNRLKFTKLHSNGGGTVEPKPSSTTLGRAGVMAVTQDFANTWVDSEPGITANNFSLDWQCSAVNF